MKISRLFPRSLRTRSIRTRSLCTLATLSALLTLSTSAFAERYLAMEPMHDRKVRVDGMLQEWPGDFFRFKDKSGKTTKTQALVGYDDDFLYLAGKIDDTTPSRSKAAGQKEDHLELVVYFPQAGGAGVSSTIEVFPGDAKKKLPAVVRVDGKKISDAQAVENPSSSGFALEAKIPWSAIRGGKAQRLGLRGKLQYFDASSVGRVQSISHHGTGAGRTMLPLTSESETGLIQALLEPRGLALIPDREVYGDLTGKGGPEKVALYGHFLSILGPGYKGGKQFYFNELDVEKASQITRLSLVDFDGDGMKEIVLQKQLGSSEKYREVLQVLQLGPDGAPLQIFAHEVALVTPEGRVENKVAISSSGKTSRIRISQGTARGFEPGTFSEPTIGGGIESALLPWQEVGTQTYGYRGQGLTLLSEDEWTPTMKANTGASTRPTVAAPPPPRPPSADEMLSRVYALYKSDRKVRSSQEPSFDFVTDVVEDEQMERVLIVGRDLVVFGKGFKKGLSYTYLTIGVEDEKDILSVTTRDLVGDGKAEILVHAVLNAQASESLGGDIVGRQALFVYKVLGQNLTRIFAAETARSLKGNRILSSLAFLPGPRGYEIELRPLRAIGWSQKTYPFPEDHHPAGGLEPLLLPWTTVGTRRYVFDGTAYQKQ